MFRFFEKVMPISPELLDKIGTNSDPALTTLSVSRGSNIIALAEALKTNTTLQSVSLGFRTYITLEGSRALAEALKINTTLKILNLRHSGLKTQGVSIMLGSLKNNASLQHLDLRENYVYYEHTKAVEDALVEALRNNSTLLSLHLEADHTYNDAYAPTNYYTSNDYAIAAALETNTTLLELDTLSTIGSTYLKRNQDLDKELKLSICLKPLGDFHQNNSLDLDDINTQINALTTLEPRILSTIDALPETEYVYENYRLLIALSHLAGAHPLGVLEILEAPFHHSDLQAIADKAFAQALMATTATQGLETARYKLLAYTGRNNPKHSEFATGIIGAHKNEGENIEPNELTPFLENPHLLPNGAAWLTYDEIHTLTKKAYEQSDPESLEGLFLAELIQQKEYCPITVFACFNSPKFLKILLEAHPRQATFQCLEGYLGFQKIMPALKEIFAMPDIMAKRTLIKPIDEDELRSYQDGMQHKNTAYPNFQAEIIALKRAVIQPLEEHDEEADAGPKGP